MKSLIYLTPKDFTEKMVHGIRGTSIVLFYAGGCQFSMVLLPIFKKMPKSDIHGVQFGVMNVGFYKEIVQKAKDSDTPIEYVPLIIMYNNGVPSVKYEGELTEQGLLEFIKAMHEKNKTEAGKKKSAKREYCEGNPLCGDDEECYLKVCESSKN